MHRVIIVATTCRSIITRTIELNADIITHYTDEFVSPT